MLYGGTHGSLFSFDLATMTSSTLHTFSSTKEGDASDGISMTGDMIYGFNTHGGTNSNGTIFSYNLTSNTFAILEETPSNSSYRGIISSGNYLFTVKLDSTVGYSIASMDLTANAPVFSSVASIDSTTIGFQPGPNLAEYNGVVYGIMNDGGTNNLGGIFKLETSTSTLSQVLNFDETTGFYSFNTELLITPAEDPQGLNDNDGMGNIYVYPNPSSGIYTIAIEDIKEFSLYNNLGTLLFTKEGTSEVNLTNYSSGLYIIKVTTTKGEVTEKLIKE